MNEILITRDNKEKIRLIYMCCCFDDKSKTYMFTRQTQQLDGKLTSQPNIIIDSGKAKRTIQEQAELVFNSYLNKYLSKGYKNIKSLGYNKLEDITDYTSLLKTETTDSNGAMKPMLAKQADSIAISVFEREYWASRKLDGVRCMMWYDPTINDVRTSSRGGKNYDIPSTHIRKDPALYTYLKTNPHIILDGELYKHGLTLNIISGICRLQTLGPRHDPLEFHIYDLGIKDKTFIERKKILDEMKSQSFSNKIHIVEHILVKSWTSIKSLHDKFIKEGYEGCVIRDPSKEYGFNKRDNRMIKIKEFDDAEFKIIGIDEGLRDEDMCFILVTTNGNEFKAKPVGDRSIKEDYRKNINKIIGEMGTVKFFGYTPYGTPNLPIFKSIRNYE